MDNFIFTIESVEKYLFHDERVHLNDTVYQRIRHCYDFLKSFATNRIIYGINTGFGPMAQWRVEDKHL